MSDLKDRLWEVMRRNEERADALDLERQKAEIRQWSYALKWTGTPDELTATITKWYESSWIIAGEPARMLADGFYPLCKTGW